LHNPWAGAVSNINGPLRLEIKGLLISGTPQLKGIAQHQNQQDLTHPWRIFIFILFFGSILWF